MNKECENRYKICREIAGLTQEQAAEKLSVSLRMLSNYENDHSPVPDDIVDAMAELYDCTLLALWHLKETSVLGRHLPTITMPQTNGDMAFELILAQDGLAPSVMEVKRIVSSGEFCEVKKLELEKAMEAIRQAKSKLWAVILYAGKLIEKNETGEGSHER